MVRLDFDSTSVPANEFEVLPPGNYVAHVVSEDWRETKEGTGHYLFLELQITCGPGAGRKLFERLNLDNANAQAKQIAERTLSSICKALDIESLGDSSELLNKPMTVKVGIEKRADTGEDANRIRGYKKYDGPPIAPDAQLPADVPF